MNLFDAVMAFDDADPAGYRGGAAHLRVELGAEQIVFNVFELPPGEALCPYHYEDDCEEWIIVLSGRLMLRTPGGEQEMGPWDCYFCPEGPPGAHKTSNPFDEPCRFAIWSNRLATATAVYPDSNKLGAWPIDKLFRISDAVDYYDGEV